jgi:hypothetical protein
MFVLAATVGEGTTPKLPPHAVGRGFEEDGAGAVGRGKRTGGARPCLSATALRRTTDHCRQPA